MISKIERTVKQVYEKTYSDEDFAGLNMDCYSPLKIASAICRLDLKNKIDEDSFDRYGAIFNEIMYDFIEFKKDVVDSNPDRETWTVPNVEVSNQDNRLEYLDHQLLRIIRKVEEEQGKEWVSRMDIELHPTFDMKLRGDWKVDDSLRRLNNIGKIIKSPHGLGYKRLKLQ
jgi:carboxypeptidase C (cathepsin A)